MFAGTKTPIDMIDGTEIGKKHAYSQLAVLAVMGGSMACMIPFISGGVLTGGAAAPVLAVAPFLAKIHWLKVAMWSTIGNWVWAETRKIPKKVGVPKIVPHSWVVPIGKTWRGKWVYFDFSGITPHAKIAGATGFGKSAFMKLCLYVLCRQHTVEDMQVVIIDLKGGATFDQWSVLPHVLTVERHTAGALKALDACEQEMWRRVEEIRQAKINFRKVPKFPKLFIVIDEGGELAPKDAIGKEKEMREKCMNHLSALSRIGREPCVHLIHGTQRPSADTLPMTIRENLEGTFCFKVNEAGTSEIVLGHGNTEAFKLKKHRGLMVHKSPNGYTTLQAAYVDDATVEEWLKSHSDTPCDVEWQWSEDKGEGVSGSGSPSYNAGDITFLAGD